MGVGSQIVGAESFTMRNVESHYELLHRHIVKVRQIRGLESAMAVIAVESNFGNEALHHEAALRGMGLINICMLRECRDGKPGILTTNTSKRTMAVYLNNYLTSNRVFFHRNFVTASSGRKMNAAKIREAIINQLLAYNRVVVPPNNIYGRAKEIYSGKGGGDKDDVVIALQINVMAKICFFFSPEKYGEFYADDGRRREAVALPARQLTHARDLE